MLQLRASAQAEAAAVAQDLAALHRLDTATYGACERCGQPIAEERLAARPFARCCVTCA